MYGKIFKQMYKGTLAMVGPWEALVTFQQMIVLADIDGVVDMTADAIARETTIPIKIIAKGVEALEQPDPESRTPDHEGRRIVRLSENRTWGWQIVNYAHYRKLRDEEERREYHRNYWRENRSKSATKKNSTTTQQNSTDSTNRRGRSRSRGSKEKREGAKRAPNDFAVSIEMYEWAETSCQISASDVLSETEVFKDHEFKVAKKDWQAVWRNWMRRSSKWRNDEKAKRSDSFDAKLARTRQRAGL